MNYFILGITVAGLIICFKTDDTDKSFFKRSGVHLYTDYKTGLQYLGDVKGGITPRLDAKGKHMRIKK